MQEQLRDNFSETENNNREGLEIAENIFLDEKKKEITVYRDGWCIEFLYQKNKLDVLSETNYSWDSGEGVTRYGKLNKVKNEVLSALKKFQSKKSSIVTKEMIESARRFETAEEKRSHGGFDDEDVVLCE